MSDELAAGLRAAKAAGDPAMLGEVIPYARFLGVRFALVDGLLTGTLAYGDHLIGNPVLAHPTVDQMFNTGLIDSTGKIVNAIPNLPPAFQIQAPFTLRTASLYFGNLRDRWGPDFNLALVKSTQIRERLRLELRGEALNVLNHPLWGGDPVIVPTSPNFGKLLVNNGQTNEPRQVQLSLRLVF